MATANVSAFLHRLTRGMVEETLADHSDRQLVERLLARPDEAAFEAIVRRHGPMVYRVCWRVLQQEQDTEDAFQATFLILARQSRTVRRPASLASWLHGIARRVALKARAHDAARRRHEQKAATANVPPDDVPWQELRGVLDAELERLPEKWRLPLILCYLEGQTQEEAARQLGWSQRTLRRRLEEARAALGRRLTGRGVVWPAALSAVLLSDCVAPAALVPRLLRSTMEAAAFIAAGKAMPAAAVSANVAALTEGVLKTMFTSRLKTATAVLVLLTALGVVAGGLLYQTNAAEPPPPANPERPAAGAGGKPQVALRPIVITDDGPLVRVGWNADGKSVVTLGHTPEVVELKESGRKIWVSRAPIKLWDAATGKLERSLGEEKDRYNVDGRLAFSRDRQTAALCISGQIFDREKGELVATPEYEVRVMNARTWELNYQFTDKDVNMSMKAIALSPDGKRLALVGDSLKLWDVAKRKLIERKPKEGEQSLRTMYCLAFSPDGKLIAAGEQGGTIRLFDGQSGEPKARLMDQDDPNTYVYQIAYSPDGKTLASLIQDKTVKLWDVSEAKLRQTLKKGDRFWSLDFSPDGKLLATGGGVEKENNKWEYEVILWDAKSGEMKQTLADEQALSLAFSPDGKTLAIAGSGKTGSGFR
jgi:RNA polymerase sigma factor (sigma-70 family)